MPALSLWKRVVIACGVAVALWSVGFLTTS
jgi:hypothetical protein